MSSARLSLTQLCVDGLEELATRHAPGLHLPPVLGGHPVGSDARADLAWTCAQLAQCGITTVAGRTASDIARDALLRVDPETTTPFAAYRIAESLCAFPDVAASLSAEQRARLARACTTTHLLDELQTWLPRNYAPVLARAEAARLAAGLGGEPAATERALTATHQVLAGSSPFFDDGDGRYDIYALDSWLFAEPLRHELGSVWSDGVRHALHLAERVGHPSGAALTWGRSTGPLAVALTLELAALAVQLGHPHRRRWLARARDAARAWPLWFSGGLTSAHVGRAQDGYRGPERRLQLTLDLLGKLAWSARSLEPVMSEEPDVEYGEAYPPLDDVTWFDEQRRLGVWTHRGQGLDFVLPLVSPVRSHYLPAPSWPGVFETPCDQTLVCWAPAIETPQGRYAAAGEPTAAAHSPSALTASWSGFPDVRSYTDPTALELPGRRSATFRVSGDMLVVEDVLELDDPGAVTSVTVAVPEAGTPLRVQAEGLSVAGVRSVDVDGVAEWRSSWSQLRRVHEVELAPAREMRWRLRVVPG